LYQDAQTQVYTPVLSVAASVAWWLLHQSRKASKPAVVVAKEHICLLITPLAAVSARQATTDLLMHVQKQQRS
jgi:hypothetical protein